MTAIRVECPSCDTGRITDEHPGDPGRHERNCPTCHGYAEVTQPCEFHGCTRDAEVEVAGWLFCEAHAAVERADSFGEMAA